MNEKTPASHDDIRALFSSAMSEMYRREVPLYGALLDIVADVNAATLERTGAKLGDGSTARIDAERHGAIRVGTAQELSILRRMFAVMGMVPVGYYDLSVAGIPVHSTAFRPTNPESLARNPFRMFTSLLRLELIEDAALRQQAQSILSQRNIFSDEALSLTEKYEAQGELSGEDAKRFVDTLMHSFRWHAQANVDAGTFQRLRDAHPLIADVVSFRGPHINHLTPRTLDIEAVQAEMPRRGIAAKAVIEGPPARKVPILLRQTSFKAIEEPVEFRQEDAWVAGSHTARFGEVEQRGVALTPKGRALYDTLLQKARTSEATSTAEIFAAFPDDLDALRREALAFFRYEWTGEGDGPISGGLDQLVEQGRVRADPITYEDFLPVSAAGIFQSNLGTDGAMALAAESAQAEFEAALGAAVHDEFALYAAEQQASIDALGL